MKVRRGSIFTKGKANFSWKICIKEYGEMGTLFGEDVAFRGQMEFSPLKTNKTIICLRLEGDGTPLQYSCLKNPTDGGSW